MTNKIAEHTISFYEHFYDDDKDTVRFMVSGFVPTYDPIFLTKGKPETMDVFAERLSNLLGVIVELKKPSPKHIPGA